MKSLQTLIAPLSLLLPVTLLLAPRFGFASASELHPPSSLCAFLIVPTSSGVPKAPCRRPGTSHTRTSLHSQAAVPRKDSSVSSSSSVVVVDGGTRWADSGRWENQEAGQDTGAEQFLLKEKYGTYFKVPNPASLMTKVICTMGPATSDPTTIGKMMDAGMSAARINLSHGDHEALENIIDTVRAVAETRVKLCPIILDTKGPEIRVSWVSKSPTLHLQSGDAFVLWTGKHSSVVVATNNNNNNSNATKAAETAPSSLATAAASATVTYPYLSRAVHKGDVILLNDGRISLIVTQIPNDNQVHTQVIEGGDLVVNKGVNLPGCHVELPHLTDKDIQDIAFGVSKRVEYIAHSFTRSATGINQVRELPGVVETGCHVIAKIESQEGLDNFAGILRVSDGVMVARGDLGVEIPLERVCSVQKRLVQSCNRVGKPVIVATELLDSMMMHPRPTRAEASDVANAVFDGADCVMLSGETAVGKYPVEAVQVMTRICKEAELDVASSLRAMSSSSPGGDMTRGQLDATRWINGGGVGGMLSGRSDSLDTSEGGALRDAFAKSAIMTARETGADLIIAITRTGITANALAKFFSPVPVMVLTMSPQVCAQVLLHRSVTPYLVRSLKRESCVPRAVSKATELGLVRPGSRVLLLTGRDDLTANRLETFVVGEGVLPSITSFQGGESQEEAGTSVRNDE